MSCAELVALLAGRGLLEALALPGAGGTLEIVDALAGAVALAAALGQAIAVFFAAASFGAATGAANPGSDGAGTASESPSDRAGFSSDSADVVSDGPGAFLGCSGSAMVGVEAGGAVSKASHPLRRQ